jgi:outer membrane protein, multidrug efflux system
MFDFVSLDLRNLLDSGSRQYGGTAAITWPIFDGNRIRANIRIRDEQNRQALYAYRKSVIRALQDVEDALTRYADERARGQGAADRDVNLSMDTAATGRAREVVAIAGEMIGAAQKVTPQ